MITMQRDPAAASARSIARVLRAVDRAGECVERYADLRRAFSVRVPCVAEYLLSPADEIQLASLWRALIEEGVGVRILGGGTNTIPVNSFLAGVTITLSRMSGIVASTDLEGELSVRAGTPLQALCREAERRSLSGLEALAGVPGSVAGALVMNAGGRGCNIGAHVVSVDVLEPDGRMNVLTAEESGFGYRTSSLSGRLVMSARLRLQAGDPVAIRSARLEAARRKRTVQPLGAHSAGCYFKNPGDGISTGQLLDRAGLKGACEGGAESSTHHANFLVNRGGATGADFAALGERLRARVREIYGLELEEEVKLWR